MSKKFQRTKEDFTCEKCNTKVKGSGYTNHCPHCLWSKHVDINPGDRNNNCQGALQPTAIETKGEETIITHTCTKCGTIKKNKAAENDNFEEIITISQNNSHG